MCLPLPAQKLLSLARIIIRLRRFQSAGETESTRGKEKPAEHFLISTLFLTRKKK